MSRDVQKPEEEARGAPESSGEVSHLIVGRILGVRGLGGELKVQILTDFPKRFAALKRVLVGDQLTPFEVETTRLYKNYVLMKLRDVSTPEQAERLRGKLIKVPVEEAVRLAEDQFYWYQIIGLEVWTTSGDFVGKVTEIIETGANDVYLVRSNTREVLIPAVSNVIKEIALDKGKIIIEPMPGLLD